MSKRELRTQIVEFVIAWDEVIDIKLKEFDLSPEKREELQRCNQEIVDKDPSSYFSYIYTLLQINDDGKIAPHMSTNITPEKRGRLRNNIYPIAADIVDYFCKYKPGRFNDDLSVNNAVRLTLKSLKEKGKITLAEDSTYRPITIEYHRKTLMDKFVNYVPIDEKGFFPISKNTYVVYFQGNKLSNEIAFLKDFIGEKALFDIIQQGQLLLILIKGNLEETEKVGRSIRKLIKNTYNLQEENRKKALNSDEQYNTIMQ